MTGVCASCAYSTLDGDSLYSLLPSKILGQAQQVLANTANGDVTIITEMTKQGDDLLLTGLHIDGHGVGSIGIKRHPTQESVPKQVMDLRGSLVLFTFLVKAEYAEQKFITPDQAANPG